MEQTYAIEIIHPSDLENLTSSDNVIELTDIGIIGLDSLCRICANRSDNLIPIYEGEGIEYQLEMKINRHFPFTVEKSDALPTHCCYQCASTLLTWHELVEASIEADKRLKALQFETVVQLNQKFENLEEPNGSVVEPEETTVNIIVPTTIESRLAQSRAADVVSIRQVQSNNFTVDYLSESCKKLKESNSDDELSVKNYNNFSDDDDDNKFKLEDDKFKLEDKSKLEEESILDDKPILEETVYTETDDKLTLEDGKLRLENSASPTPDVKCEFSDINNETNIYIDSNTKITKKMICRKNKRKKRRILKTKIMKIHCNDLDENTYTCGKCQKEFTSSTELSNHLKQHVSFEIEDDLMKDELEDGIEIQIGKICMCLYCGANFTNRKQLQEHKLLKHKSDKLCRTKLNKDDIEQARVIIDKRTYYQCKECGKKLHSPYTYMWHRRIHTGERPFVCDLCGKQFRVSQGLVRHLRETHAGIKNFPCDLCGRMFASRRNVEEHRRIHTNERPYVCDLCGKAFKQKASLFVHNRSHSDIFPHKCSYCGQGFRTKAPLLVHVTRHTGEKPYPCDICGRCFRIKYELNRHRLVHSDEKPFSCDDCGVSFRQKRYLRNHNKVNHKHQQNVPST